MTDVFASLANQAHWLIAIGFLLSYSITIGIARVFLKPAMIGFLDPLNITLLLFTGPALLGVLLTPYFTNTFSESYFLILFFLGVWLLIIRLSGRPRKIDLRDKMGSDFQITLLSITILIIVLNVIVNMIIPGTIPLLTEGGVYSRFDATQNSRLLSWLSLGTSPMPGLIFAVTQKKRARRFATVALVIQTIAGLLGASKGAIVAIFFILVNAMFLAKVRHDEDRYKKIRKAVLYAAGSAACLTPLYLSLIGFGRNQAALVELGARFLGGFDQLIYASQFDLLRQNGYASSLHVNLTEYQLMPLFKALFSTKFEYSNVGQYVITMVTGIYVDGPGTFPNSNLILETVLTSGRYLGFVAFFMELACFYLCRRLALSRSVTPFSLLLLYGMVFNPFGLFLSGQEWIMEMIAVFLVVFFSNALVILWKTVGSILRLSPASHES